MSNSPTIELADIWRALEAVKDPEIPVVSVVEMGLIRDVTVSPAGVQVTMTPTFSGCPALDVIRRDILAELDRFGAPNASVQIILNPPWTSDWISDVGREKLRRFGLAPPPRLGSRADILFFEPAECPRCGSTRTTLRNTFGPTLCRMIWYCNDCRDAFEQFKAL